MDFKIGYSVRPKEITTFNRVVFEEYKIVEGKEILVEVLPTEDDCIGYHFNYYSKNCWTLSENQFIDIDGVYDYGSNNSKSFNNTNSIILGSDNNLSQGGANDLIVGDYNNIDLNTRNSIVFGTKGEASATNSIVLGGNSNNAGIIPESTNLVICGGFDCSTPLGNWAVNSDGAISIDSDRLKVLNVKNRGRAYSSITGLTIGKTYTYYVQNTKGTTTGFAHLNSGTQYNNIPLNSNFNFIAGSTTANIQVGVGTTRVGDYTYYDNISLKEVVSYIAPKQSIQLMYGLNTINDSNRVSFLNGVDNSYFDIPINSIMYFHVDILAVRVGGISKGGVIGDYASWVERGVIINAQGTLSINTGRDAIKSSGATTNWLPTAIISNNNFAIGVKGDKDMVVEWSSNITFTQIKTNINLTIPK